MRYPFDALERLIVGSVAQTLGVHRRQVSRWREYGVTADQADELAVRAGFHPAEVWPEWVAMRACGARGCDARFVPYRSNQKWCSRRCWQRERARRRYHRDPEFAAAENARARAYYAECAVTICAKERARRSARNLVQKADVKDAKDAKHPVMENAVVGGDYKYPLYKNAENTQVEGYVEADTGRLHGPALSRPRESMESMENVA